MRFCATWAALCVIVHMQIASRWIAAFVLVTACKADGGSTDCASGRCDQGVPPALEVLNVSNPVSCELRLDMSTTNPFFQVDELYCTFRAPPVTNTVKLLSNYVNVTRKDGNPGNTFEMEGPNIGSEPVLVSRFSAESYPIEVASTLVYRIDPSQGGDTSFIYNGARATVPTRPSANTAVLEHTAPFDLWPIVLWPDDELTTAWNAGEARALVSQTRHAFALASAELNIGGPNPTTEVQYRRTMVANATAVPGTPDITVLRSDVFYVPVAKQAAAPWPSLKLTVSAPFVEVESALGGPGYYVVDRNGNAVLTAPGNLPGRRDVTFDADPGPDGTDVTPDAAVADPCNGSCSPSQVCVAAACVERANQTQSTSCNAPVAQCDANEDGDCAPDHACVEGVCRRRTCQAQSTSCNAPFAACDSQDTDCADGHACVANLCRRLACQTQSTFCNSPFAQCEGDSDCAPEHACVAGLCRRLTCQTQSTFCNPPVAACADDDDSDCAPEHACVDGLCRRLTCQTQSNFCNAPVAPCQEASDCAFDHVCQGNLCTRTACL